jgi:mitogen-activated protein kinase kinase kinase
MLTVDEITSAVEHRRASTITFEDSDEEEELETASIRVPTIVEVPVGPTSDGDGEDEESEEESSDDETEEDESEEEEDEDEEDDEDADHGKAFMSTGCKSPRLRGGVTANPLAKRIIKWIKGALIGAGSFGSVFLGMDSHSGLLMAVKQVELVGKGRSMERTKGMIDALEREVELLKELQHDNIVQYLGMPSPLSCDKTRL